MSSHKAFLLSAQNSSYNTTCTRLQQKIEAKRAA